VQREQAQGEFPDDASFRVGKLMEFVHDDDRDVFEGEMHVRDFGAFVFFEIRFIDRNFGQDGLRRFCCRRRSFAERH